MSAVTDLLAALPVPEPLMAAKTSAALPVLVVDVVLAGNDSLLLADLQGTHHHHALGGIRDFDVALIERGGGNHVGHFLDHI